MRELKYKIWDTGCKKLIYKDAELPVCYTNVLLSDGKHIGFGYLCADEKKIINIGVPIPIYLILDTGNIYLNIRSYRNDKVHNNTITVNYN